MSQIVYLCTCTQGKYISTSNTVIHKHIIDQQRFLLLYMKKKTLWFLASIIYIQQAWWKLCQASYSAADDHQYATNNKNTRKACWRHTHTLSVSSTPLQTAWLSAATAGCVWWLTASSLQQHSAQVQACCHDWRGSRWIAAVAILMRNKVPLNLLLLPVYKQRWEAKPCSRQQQKYFRLWLVTVVAVLLD